MPRPTPALLVAAATLLAACGGAATTSPGAAPDGAAPAPSAAGDAVAGTAEDGPPSGSSLPTGAPDGAVEEAHDDTPAEPFDVTSQPDVAYPRGIDPHRIVVPRLGVDAPIIDLTMTATEVEVPEDFDDAGWWTQTRRPGEIGPAVIGGHVDSREGPAVFFRLHELEPGDEVAVVAEDGEQVVFVVDRVVRVDKYDRPPEVFGFGEARPELRLITCGGEFDPNLGHYVDNDVVFLHQADWEA